MAADGERSPLLSEPGDGGAGGNGLAGPGGSATGPGGGLTPSAPPYGAGKHAPPQGKPAVGGAPGPRGGSGRGRSLHRRQVRPRGTCHPRGIFLRGASVGSVRMMSGFICFLFSISPVSRGAPSRAAGRGPTPLLTPD